MIYKKYWLFSGVLGLCLHVNPVYGQIIPDGTTSSSVINNCQNTCEITGGNLAGTNLFHSFQEFNIGAGESAYFADPGVNNIFSRVTGSNSSQILGKLGISGGDANLWLLNPNGIIFGSGAALDISGSFVATTADEIQFGNSNSFSAVPNTQDNLALLTVDPSVLFFNQMAQKHPITVDSGALLAVPEQENITLLGAQIDDNKPGIHITGSLIHAPQGSIAIGAIQNSGKIKIDRDLQLSFPDDVIKGDISLTGKSRIDVSGLGGGNLSLQGDNIILTEESQITANTSGDIDGQSIDIRANNLTIVDNSFIITSTVGWGNSSNINITAQESINIIGRDVSAFQEFLQTTLSGEDHNNDLSSSIYTLSLGEGKAGDIKIQSKNLGINNGARVLASTENNGRTGNIAIDVEDSITIDGSGLITGSAIGSMGEVGTLTLNSNNLLVQNGAVISSSTLGKGLGGDINAIVANSIHLRQNFFNGVVPAGIYTNTVGDSGTAGNLTLDTSNLIISGGSQISSGSGLFTNQGLIPIGGRGGDIIINATDSIFLQGISADNRFPSGIVNTTFSHSPAGNIDIHTGKLNLQDEAIISASSIGTGDAGSLTIEADESIHLSGTGFENLQNLFQRGVSGDVEAQNLTGGLLSNTQMGKAGNTRLTSPNLILENGALISTSTFGDVAGGNIDIVAQNVEVSSSLLASSTIGTGSAGNITIETDKLATFDSGLITTSSAGLGNAGNLKINAADSIELIDRNHSVIVFGGLATNALGLSYSGNLEVNTKDLTIAGGAQISASNGRDFEIIEDEDVSSQINITEENIELNIELNSPREIIINAESIDIAGISDNNLFASGISSATNSAFPASNININTSTLEIADQGEISVSSFREGKAGNLNIIADSISLNNQGALNATTVSGQGGNIELHTRDILALASDSRIKTDALDFGNGGNINIDTTFIIASGASSITAKALSGQGGNINIEATDLFFTSDSQITASSQLGIDGEVNIKTFSTSDRHNLVKLPEKTISGNSLITKSCGSSNQKGVFTYTGKGGLPSNPLAGYYLSNLTLIPDFSLVDSDSSEKSQAFKLGRAKLTTLTENIVEASAWKVNSQGKVELVGQTQKDLVAELSNHSNCPFSE